MTYPRRLVGLEAARARFGEQADRIAAFFTEGDPLADAAVIALGETPEGRSVLTRAIDRGIDSVGDAAPPALVALFRQLEHVPFWVDHERCRRGGDVFLRCGPFGGIALGFGSLARAYCSSGGNKPLARTAALIDSAPHRIANTGRFLHAVATPDALLRGGIGYQHIVHVRLMHAGVRVDLSGQPDWLGHVWGVPINQADMALTALLFSHALAGFVRKLGVQVTREEESDLLHLWRYAGYLMGVREELLCATIDEAERLAELVDVLDGGPDEDSRRLLDALFHRPPNELPLRTPQVDQVARRIFSAACRDMIGASYADHVGLPYGPGDLAFRYVVRPTVSLLGRIHRRTPFATSRARRIGERYWAAISGDKRARQKAKDAPPESARSPSGMPSMNTTN